MRGSTCDFETLRESLEDASSSGFLRDDTMPPLSFLLPGRAALLMIAATVVSCCKFDSATVSYVVNKNVPGFFDIADVQAHLNNTINNDFRLDEVSYEPDGYSTLECVDARSGSPMHGSPGGDLAEFAMGLYTYHSLTKQVGSYSSVKSLLQQFLDCCTSATRPFYFHTDDSRLRDVFVAVGAILGRRVTILPDSSPPEAERKVWLDQLTQAAAQGCGHIRLMIQFPSTYGLASADIIRWLIQAFYEELWAADTDAK